MNDDLNDTTWVRRLDSAAYLDVSPRTLDRLVDAGKLTAYRIGSRVVRFRRSDLDALLEPVSVRHVGTRARG
ncbi:helix-turn-helix domain-containing protein [Cellulomonas xylanilytica]|uniref:Helix-turn-helix domain-containing protein n=1 Tax=Cellulomonas xylanilytica TaxID=233583 RepID=A0A510V276_9CELL|nr:helix-turn-helix domain-containing protein [Cellulomonas xylanilytica]GEK21002.1 hypothetical protein CXY01_15220 [Cellulomonas xylanilytica]